MKDGHWRTLAEIHAIVRWKRDKYQCASARFPKTKVGARTPVNRRRGETALGIHEDQMMSIQQNGSQ